MSCWKIDIADCMEHTKPDKYRHDEHQNLPTSWNNKTDEKPVDDKSDEE